MTAKSNLVSIVAILPIFNRYLFNSTSSQCNYFINKYYIIYRRSGEMRQHLATKLDHVYKKLTIETNNNEWVIVNLSVFLFHIGFFLYVLVWVRVNPFVFMNKIKMNIKCY